VSGVLIISRDWQSRALLRAQLIEEGCDVRAFVSPDQATAALVKVRTSKAESRRLRVKRGSTFSPGLVIADVSVGSDRGEIEQLANLIRSLPADVPLWVIASRAEPAQEWIGLLKEAHLENVLFRPIDGGELLERIKNRIGDGK
jgi:DNA-binding response OmpR family regulator